MSLAPFDNADSDLDSIGHGLGLNPGDESGQTVPVP